MRKYFSSFLRYHNSCNWHLLSVCHATGNI